ncbi:MAG: hypothetical protein ACLQGT_13870 [Terracidiphilus sp.]
MRSIVRVAGLATLLCLAASSAFAAAPPAPKSSHGTMVIVFKDGHRQSFNLGEIERVEFPAAPAAESATVNPSWPSRAHFLGKWEVGDGSGNNFFITLYDDGDALKSIGGKHGRWEYVDGEARITWEDGWRDAIRKVGSSYQKSAYGEGKSFTDAADNITSARNTAPHPI